MSMLSATVGYISSYTKNMSNYMVINKPNLFNFFITMMESLTDEQKETFVKQMKINMGMTMFGQFKQYIFTKLSNSPLLDYFA